MKYILINDFHYLISKWKVILLWLIILLCFPIFLKVVIGSNFTRSDVLDIFEVNLGFNYSIYSAFEYTLLLLHITFYSYLVIDCFAKDIDYGKENIFLRVSKTKWLTYKIFVVIIYTIILQFILITALFIIYSLFGSSIPTNYLVKIIILGIVSRLILQFVNIICLMINKYCGFLIIAVLFTLTSIIDIGGNFLKDILYISSNNILYLFLIIIIMFILKKILLNRLFERS